MIKTVTYSHTNTYEILYPITQSTEHIWVCFHGMGYLATYFKSHFKSLDRSRNAVFVLQAPSKYYQGSNYKYVGASWLTRVDTAQEMKNNLNYIDAVFKAEQITNDTRIILMGYSQGVSIATRYLLHYQRPIKCLIMHSGAIPKEFTQQDGNIIQSLSNQLIHIVGTDDQYLTPELLTTENNRIHKLFGTKCELHRPVIKHEVDSSILLNISNNL